MKLVNKFFEDEQEKTFFDFFYGSRKLKFFYYFLQHDRQTDTQLLANPTQNKYFDRKINQCVKASREKASNYRVFYQVCNRALHKILNIREKLDEGILDQNPLWMDQNL